MLLLGLLWQCTALVGAQSPSFGLPAANQVYDVQALRVLAGQGDKRAAFLLASRYASGRGVPRDDSEAVRWFTAAAEGGLAEAQYNLGIMYLTGRGVPLDPAKGAWWYERAAEQDLAEAQFNLGTLYGTGRGVRRDEALAVKWLTRAANRGLERAQYNLGTLYEHGRGVRVNVHTALAWYQKAAEQGFERARVRHAALAKKMQIKPQQEVNRASESVIAAPSASQVAVAEPPAEALPGAQASAPAGSVGGPASTDWVRVARADQYTVQLASFSERVEAQRFARTLGEQEPVGIYASVKGDKRWFSVVRGIFESHAAAVAAVAGLSAKLRKTKPWVRSFALIHKQMR